MPAAESRLTVRAAAMIACVTGSTLLNNFQTGTMIVALSSIQKDLNISEANLQWCLSAYSLTYGCFLLVSGRLADVLGRKQVFIAGTAWITLMSIAVAFAPNQIAFIVLNGMMGIGAAANTPAGVGILASGLQGKVKDIAFAAAGGGQPIGFIAGLCLGGVLCQTYASWRALFYIQAALGAAFGGLSYFAIPNQSTEYDDSILKRLRRIDWIGAVLSALGFALLTFSLTNAQGAAKGWATPYIPVLLAISLVLLAAFLQWERVRERAGQPTLMPLSLFKAPNFGMILAMVFSAWWSFNTLMYFVTLYCQMVLELPPIRTSLYFVPMAIAGLGLNTLAGYLVSRMRPVYLIGLGLLGSMAAPAMFAFIETKYSYWAMLFWIMILTVGPDAAYTIANIHLCASVDSQNQALAGGIFNVATRIATAVGLAVTSAVSTSVSASKTPDYSSSPSALLDGYHAAGWVCFGTAVIAMVIDVAGLRGLPIIGPDEQSAEGGVEENVELQTIVPSIKPAEGVAM